MNYRNAIIVAAALVCCVLAAACGGRVAMRPGRDAYYQVTNQIVPSQSTGSHSQEVSLRTSGVAGDFLPADLTSTTTDPNQ